MTASAYLPLVICHEQFLVALVFLAESHLTAVGVMPCAYKAGDYGGKFNKMRAEK